MDARGTQTSVGGAGDPPLSARRACLACAGLFVSTLAFAFDFVSFNHPKEIGLTAALFPLAWGAPGPAVRRALRALLPLCAGLAVCAVIALPRAQVPALLIEEFGRIALLLAFVVAAWDILEAGTGPRAILATLQAAAVTVALLALLQYAGGAGALLPAFPGYTQPMYSVFGNQDLLGGHLALALPLLLCSAVHGPPRLRLAALAGLIPVAIALVLAGSRSAWLAAAIGVAVLVFTQGGLRSPWGARAATVLALALVLALAWAWPRPIDRITGTFGKDDVGGPARLWFWDGAARMWADAPWLGKGLGQFPYWSPHFQGEALAAPDGIRHYRNSLHTDQAHSEPLEYLAETGLLGALFGAWFLARLLRRRDAMLWSALAALAVFACFNSALHSLPHALAGLLLAACLLAPAPSPGQARAAGRWALPVAVVALALLRMHAVWIPSALLAAAEDAHLGGGDAAAAYNRLHAWPWPSPAGHEGHAILLLERGEPARAHGHLLQALEGLDTGRVHRLIGDAAALAGDADTACAAYQASLFRWPDDAAVWARAWESCPARRKLLEDHALRWGIKGP